MVYYHPEIVKSGISDQSFRFQLLEASKKLVRYGLSKGCSSNCSVRSDSGFYVTPSGISFEELTHDCLVSMDFAGQVIGGGKPSSEWRVHLDILNNRPDVGAVIHTHSTFATTLACLRKDIPAFHYTIASAGGDSIRCAPYALVDSQLLSEYVLAALNGRKACLMANHGMIAVGRNLDAALAVAVEVESLCEQYLRVLQVGEPILLTEQEMSDVMSQFQSDNG